MAKDVEITFDGELSNLKGKLGDFEGDAKSWGASIAAIGVGALAAWGATAVFDTLRAGIASVTAAVGEYMQMASEAAVVEARLGAVVKATGQSAGLTADEMADYADQLREITNIDDDVIKGAETVLATFKNIKGDEFKRTTAAAADMAAALGGDVTSAAAQLGKALNDPERGLMMLAKSGVTFTDQQEQNIKAMIAMNDAAGAQRAILAQLEGQYGGTAEAVGHASGTGFKQFKLIIDDIKESIGKGLLPLLDDAAPAFEYTAMRIKTAFDSLGGMFEGLGETIKKALDVESIAEALVGSIGTVTNVVHRALLELERLALFDVESITADKAKGLQALDQLGRSLTGESGISAGERQQLSKFNNQQSLAGLETAGDAFKSAVADFKKFSVEKEKERSDREEKREKKTETAIDPNIAAFTKAFPELKANLDGLKAFGSQISGGASGALNQATDIASKIAGPLAETMQESLGVIGGAFKGGKDEEFKAQQDSLAGLFNRIQSSAASTETKREDKKIELAEKTANATVQLPALLNSLVAGVTQLVQKPNGGAVLG